MATSIVAWAGVAVGADFIREGVQDGRVRQLVLAYVQDVTASLGPGPLDLAVAADSAAKLREFVPAGVSA